VEGSAMADEAMHIATAADHPFSLSFACWAVGLVSLRRGELDRATSALARGLEIGRVWGIVNLFLHCGAALGYVRALLGHDAEAQRLIDEAATSGASRRVRWFQSLRDGWYAETHLLADRVGEARQLAQDALRLAEAHEEIGCRAWLLRLLGDVAAHGGPPEVEDAVAYHCQALTLAESLGMRPLVAHCHFGLGKLYCSTGDRTKAEEHLATATAMYREMGMAHWLPEVEALLQQVA
jgi:tetratricopeptide (TPR) repeat protein